MHVVNHFVTKEDLVNGKVTNRSYGSQRKEDSVIRYIYKQYYPYGTEFQSCQWLIYKTWKLKGVCDHHRGDEWEVGEVL